MDPKNNTNLPDWKEQISKNWGNYCSNCGTKKEEDSLKFSRKIGIAFQYVSECKSCGMKTVISLVPNIGMQIAQIRTDISPAEFDKFTKPISNEDYVEFYSNLKDLNNISDLMKYLKD